MKVAVVTWIDSCYQRGEADVEDIEPFVILHSAGHLVKETEESISLAIDRYGGDVALPFRYISSIPKVCIREMREFDPVTNEGIYRCVGGVWG